MDEIKRLAQEALDVQNACNLVAVANGMGRAIGKLREIVSWDEAYAHPIAVLWADKIASLTGTQTLADERVMAAYTAVRKIVEA